MKSVRKSNLFTTSLIMLFFFGLIGFWGCEKGELFGKDYSEHLDLGTFELSKMSEKDMNIMSQALQRLDIDMKEGLYHVKQTSGAEVNISEELFNYLVAGFEHTNTIFKPKSVDTSIVRLKYGFMEGDGEPQDSTYCVAHALAGMGGVSFGRARAYIDSLYGSNGVPAYAMDSVISHFYPNARRYDSPIPGRPVNNTLIWFHTSDSTGHAVNGWHYDSNSGYILYKDSQNGDYIYPIKADSISSIYYP